MKHPFCKTPIHTFWILLTHPGFSKVNVRQFARSFGMNVQVPQKNCPWLYTQIGYHTSILNGHQSHHDHFGIDGELKPYHWRVILGPIGVYHQLKVSPQGLWSVGFHHTPYSRFISSTGSKTCDEVQPQADGYSTPKKYILQYIYMYIYIYL